MWWWYKLFGAIAFTGIALYIFVREILKLRRFLKFGIRTQARRISIVKLDDPDGIEVPRVEFQDEQGNIIHVTLEWSLNSQRTEFINIIYDPANPQRVIPDSWIKYIGLVFAVIILLFPIALIMNFENDEVLP